MNIKSIPILAAIVAILSLANPLHALFTTSFDTEAEFTQNFNSYGNTDGLSWDAGGYIRQFENEIGSTGSNSTSVLVPNGAQQIFAVDNVQIAMDFRFTGLQAPSLGFYFGALGGETPDDSLFALFTASTSNIRYRFWTGGNPSTSSPGTLASGGDTTVNTVNTGGTGQPPALQQDVWYHLQLSTLILNDNQIQATISWYGYDSNEKTLLHERAYTYSAALSADHLEGGQVGMRMIRPAGAETHVGSYTIVPEARHAGLIFGVIIACTMTYFRRKRGGGFQS